MPDQTSTKVYVDLSVFTKDASFGHINGDMLFPRVPGVGEIISFNHPDSCGEVDLIGTVRVASIGDADGEPALMLSDVCVDTKDDAFRVSRFLEKRFGLFADIHDDGDLRAYRYQGRSRRD